jgi:hypothetical protein
LCDKPSLLPSLRALGGLCVRPSPETRFIATGVGIRGNGGRCGAGVTCFHKFIFAFPFTPYAITNHVITETNHVITEKTV